VGITFCPQSYAQDKKTRKSAGFLKRKMKNLFRTTSYLVFEETTHFQGIPWSQKLSTAAYKLFNSV